MKLFEHQPKHGQGRCASLGEARVRTYRVTLIDL